MGNVPVEHRRFVVDRFGKIAVLQEIDHPEHRFELFARHRVNSTSGFGLTFISLLVFSQFWTTHLEHHVPRRSPRHRQRRCGSCSQTDRRNFRRSGEVRSASPRWLHVVFELLIHLCRHGFEQGQIDALLHQIELGIKHQTENFGLKIVLVRRKINQERFFSA